MLRWIGAHQFAIGDLRFLSTGDKDFNDTKFLSFFLGEESRVDRFVVWKTRAIIDRYTEVIEALDAKRIFELGIMKGGSTAFLAATSRPQKLVAIELAKEEVEPLAVHRGAGLRVERQDVLRRGSSRSACTRVDPDRRVRGRRTRPSNR